MSDYKITVEYIYKDNFCNPSLHDICIQAIFVQQYKHVVGSDKVDDDDDDVFPLRSHLRRFPYPLACLARDYLEQVLVWKWDKVLDINFRHEKSSNPSADANLGYSKFPQIESFIFTQ